MNELPLDSLRPLDPRHDACERLETRWVCFVLLLLAGSATAFLVWRGAVPSWLRGWLYGGIPLAVVLLYAGSRWYTRAELRVTRWGIDPIALRLRRGVVFRHTIDVPRSRVQHTDVSRGPLERRFGLATLVVYTAGTHNAQLRIGGLSHEDALEARHALIEETDDHAQEDLAGAGDQPLLWTDAPESPPSRGAPEVGRE